MMIVMYYHLFATVPLIFSHPLEVNNFWHRLFRVCLIWAHIEEQESVKSNCIEGLNFSAWPAEFSPEMSYWGNTKRREEGGGTANRIKLPSHQQQQQQQRAMSVYVCVCSQVLVRSEKDLPGPHWFSVLEPNLWVGAPLWKAWKLGSSSSEDEWEEGAHQRAEPSGWAQIRTFLWTLICKKCSLLSYNQMNVRLVNVFMHIQY